MKNKNYRKYLVIGIIILFVGASFIPSVMSIDTQKTLTITIIQNDKWYVEVSGNNNNNGTSWGDAWRDINYAVSQANNSDTIKVGTGTYNEEVVITKQLILEGNRTNEIEGSIIDGSSVCIFILGNNAGGTKILNFTISNSDIAGILILDSNDIIISKNTIKLNRDGILGYSCNGINFAIIENNIIENDDRGIYLENSRDCTIQGNHIKNSWYGGIDILRCEDVFIYWNNIEDIPGFDIYIHDSGIEDVIEIRKNNFINNSEWVIEDNGRDINWAFSKNEWKENYWSNWRGRLPFYVVWGTKKFVIGPFDILFPWFQLDKEPSKTEHDIPVP